MKHVASTLASMDYGFQRKLEASVEKKINIPSKTNTFYVFFSGGRGGGEVN